MKMFGELRSRILLFGVLALLLAACGGQKDSITGLTLSEDSLELEVGDTATLTAELEYESEKTISVGAADITWESSDPEVASVTEGEVTAEADGEATVTATHEPSGQSASADVSVTDPEKPDDGGEPDNGEEPDDGKKPGEGEEPDDGEEPSEGEEPDDGEDTDPKPEITVQITGPDAATLFVTEQLSFSAAVTGTENTDVTWSIDSSGIIELNDVTSNDVTITALAEGLVTLTVTSREDNSKSASAQITVESTSAFDPNEVYVAETVRAAGAERGTEANPFSNVNEALNHPELADDAIINVAEGKYAEEASLTLSGHELRGAGSRVTTLEVDAGNCDGIRITEGSSDGLILGVTLDVANLDDRNAASCQGEAPRGIIAVETQDLTIRDVAVIGAEDTDADKALAGITLWVTEGTEMEEVKVSHTQRSGVELNGGHDITLRNISVHNAGQGPGLPDTDLQSGFGAFGFYSGNNSDELKGVVLGGEFVVTDSAQRNVFTVHPKQKKYFQMSLENDFSFDVDESAAVYVQNFQDIKASSGHLVEISSGYAGFIEALGSTHSVLFQAPGDNGTSIAAYTSKEAALDYIDTTFREHLVFAVELDLPRTEPSDVTHGRLAVNNFIAIPEFGWKLDELAVSANGYAANNLLGEGIQVLEGVHEIAEPIDIHAGFRIQAAGPERPVIQGVGNQQGVGVVFDGAAGAEVNGLHFRNFETALNVKSGNEGLYLHDLEVSDAVTAINVEADHDVTGLRIMNSYIHDTMHGITIYNSDVNATPASDVHLEDIRVEDVDFKGFYLEAFDESVIKNVVMSNVGNGYGLDGAYGPAAVALEINLKYHDYGTVRLESVQIEGSGWSNGGTGQPHDANAASLAVAVRNDGSSYGAAPASLAVLELEDVTIAGAHTALRLGESFDLNDSSILPTTGADVTTLAGVALSSQGRLIANYASQDVDMTEGNNKLMTYSIPIQTPVGATTVRAKILDNLDDARLGRVLLE